MSQAWQPSAVLRAACCKHVHRTCRSVARVRAATTPVTVYRRWQGRPVRVHVQVSGASVYRLRIGVAVARAGRLWLDKMGLLSSCCSSMVHNLAGLGPSDGYRGGVITHA